MQFLDDRAGNKAQIVTLTRMVVELSDAMKGGVLADFIREAARISSEWWIANLEPEEEQRKAYERILVSLKSLWSSHVEAAMVALIRVAPPEVVQRAIASLQRIGDTAEPLGAIFVVTPYLADGLSPARVGGVMLHGNVFVPQLPQCRGDGDPAIHEIRISGRDVDARHGECAVLQRHRGPVSNPAVAADQLQVSPPQ